MAGRLVFITGGARSGKSAFAERLALAHHGPVAYIPTAAITDGEMARRVALHQQRRPADWVTVEAEGNLAAAITRAAISASCLVVDCLTVYLARLLPPDLPVESAVSADVLADLDARLDGELEGILRACRESGRDVVVVSNEVGAGLVPPYPSGRLFRDMVGRANRRLATAADDAYVVVAGCPLDLKALHATRLPWGGGL
jgi:adenosylcobinamide kinase / adenosylcobinamide-phosphate guanylyltransferase